MGTSFGAVIPVTGLDVGFLGQVSRTGERVIAARQANSSNTHNISFGDAVVLLGDATGGTYQGIADYITGGGTFTAAKFAGVAVREVKTNLVYLSLLTTPGVAIIGYYAPGEITEVLERGSICVKFNVPGSPIAGGPVYIRTVLNGAIPAGVVGGFEGAADGGNTVLLTGVVFRTGVVDSDNVAEITLLTRVAA